MAKGYKLGENALGQINSGLNDVAFLMGGQSQREEHGDTPITEYFAMITGADATYPWRYTADEQLWDEGTRAYVTVGGGITWGSTSNDVGWLDELNENGSVLIGAIVHVTAWGDNDDDVHWSFDIHSNALLADFYPTVVDDGDGTKSVVIASGRVETAEGTGVIAAVTYPLETAGFVYVNIYVPALSTSAAFTPSFNAGRQSYYTYAGGVVNMNVVIGEIVGGEYIAEQIGSVKLGSVLYGTNTGIVNEDILTGASFSSGTLTFSKKHYNNTIRGGKVQSAVFTGTTADTLTFTQITALTDFRYDSTSHEFQKKTVTGWLLNAGAESAWTSAGDTTASTVISDLRVDGLTLQKKTKTEYTLELPAESDWTTWHTGDDCT